MPEPKSYIHMNDNGDGTTTMKVRFDPGSEEIFVVPHPLTAFLDSFTISDEVADYLDTNVTVIPNTIEG